MSEQKAQTAPKSGVFRDGKILRVNVFYWIIAAAGAALLCWLARDAVSRGIIFVVSFLLGLAGAVIGNKVRLFTQPDAMFTRGLMDTLGQKIFWRIGPQFIGTVIGVVGGALVIAPLLGAVCPLCKEIVNH